MILGFEKRYVFIPVVISISLVLGAYLVAQAGQSRLQKATEQANEVQARLSALGAVIRLVTDSETAVYGYLLTEDKEYLPQFEAAEAEIETALQEVRNQYPATLTPDREKWMQDLNTLVNRKMTRMRQTIAVQQQQGRAEALRLVQGSIVVDTMSAIRDIVRAQQRTEAERLHDLSVDARSDFLLARTITAAGMVLNIILVIVAGLLLTREIKRRRAYTADLAAQKTELEREVAQRTEELSELSSYLQKISEQEKAALARELHDELGGLLVAVKMDLAALAERMTGADTDLQKRWERIMQALDDGVNLKRRVVDQLHPSLLDTMGLYAALRWQVEQSCGRADLACDVSLPDNELPLSKEASIALFRVAQESLTNILKHANATAAMLSIVIEDDELVLRVTDNGGGLRKGQARRGTGVASMRHRIVGLGGTFAMRANRSGPGTEIEARVPLSKIQIAPA